MFILRESRGRGLHEARGNWKNRYKHYATYTSRDDLMKIRSLVLHQQIASKLLDYTKDFESSNERKDHLFEVSVEVKECDFGPVFITKYGEVLMVIKYEIISCNGKSLDRAHAFRIAEEDGRKANDYQDLNVRSWNDIIESKCIYYRLGPDVNKQLEASFNLIHNYPTNIHADKDDGQYFNNCSLKTLYIKSFVPAADDEDTHNHKHKAFVLRSMFNRHELDNTFIRTLKQVPPAIQRRDQSAKGQGEIERNRDVEDYCYDTPRHCNLRVKSLSSISGDSFNHILGFLHHNNVAAVSITSKFLHERTNKC